MAPDGAAPGMALPVGRSNCRLVDLDPEPGAGEAFDVPVHEAEWLGIEEVVEHLGALVVVDSDALFLDEVVRSREADLQARGERKRAERAVRRELDVKRLRESRDLAGLGDAASMRDVRLRDGDACGQDGKAARRWTPAWSWIGRSRR